MLIKTIDEVKRYATVNNEFDSLVPDFAVVQKLYIDKYLGVRFRNAIQTAYDANTMSDVITIVLGYCQEVIVNYGLAQYIPLAQVSVSDIGITMPVNKANSWVVADLKESFITKGEVAIEALLAYLEANNQHTDIVDDWTATSYYTVEKDLIILSASQIQQYVDISESRRVYMKLRPVFRNIELLKLVNLFGQVFFDTVKANRASLDANWIGLFGYLRPFLVHQGIVDGLESLSININSEGVLVFEKKETRDEGGLKTKASLESMNRIVQQHSIYADSYMVKMRAYLSATASVSVFPEYYSFIQVPLADKVVYVERNALANKSFRA